MQKNFENRFFLAYLWNTKTTVMKKIAALLLAITFYLSGFANDRDSLAIIKERIQHFTDSINNSMKWETGKLSISNGDINLSIPPGYRFLNAEQSRYVLEELWGNLKDSSILGMVFPINKGPIDDSTFAFVVTFEQMGYVKDDDADDINYDDLLKSLREENVTSNAERVKQGLATFTLVGWAQPPYYDKTNKVLHWAKEYKVEGSESNTLNYDIRILGRKGVLSFNAVGGMEQLPIVKKDISDILKMASFTEGNKYSDFDPKIDEVAAWTIGGLVAGKVLAKVGLWAVFAKFFKFILIGVVAAGGAIWRFITGRKKKEEEAVVTTETEPATETETPEEKSGE